MNLLNVVNINDCERVFKCHRERTYYKMENDDLLFRKEGVKEWKRSTLTIRELRQYIVEEVELGRRESSGEIYYFINDEGNIEEDEEEFLSVDDNRYKFGNYFESKEEAEVCRDLIKKTIKAFREEDKSKKELERYIKNIKRL